MSYLPRQQRDLSMICVVQDTKDVIAMEKMRDYNGLYHVLHGAISPMDGIGPEDINVPPLLKRLQDERVEELIFSNKPYNRRRSYSHVYFSLSKAFRYHDDKNCSWPTCWWRFGICG